MLDRQNDQQMDRLITIGYPQCGSIKKSTVPLKLIFWKEFFYEWNSFMTVIDFKNYQYVYLKWP